MSVNVMSEKIQVADTEETFVELMTIPWEARRSKTVLKSLRCCSGVALAIRTSSM